MRERQRQTERMVETLQDERNYARIDSMMLQVQLNSMEQRAQETERQARQIRESLKASRDRQKSYANKGASLWNSRLATGLC